MREEAASTLTAIYEAFSNLDWDRAFALLDDNFVWTFDPDGFLTGTYSGAVEIREAIESFTDVWQEFRVEMDDVFELDEEHVAVAARVVGRGAGSDLPIELNQTVVWTIRDGRVLEAREFLGRPGEARDKIAKQFA